MGVHEQGYRRSALFLSIDSNHHAPICGLGPLSCSYTMPRAILWRTDQPCVLDTDQRGEVCSKEVIADNNNYKKNGNYDKHILT